MAAKTTGTGKYRVVEATDAGFPFLEFYRSEVIDEICQLNGVDPTRFKTVPERKNVLEKFPFLTIPLLLPQAKEEETKTPSRDTKLKNFQQLKDKDDIEDYLDKFEEQAVFQEKKLPDWPLLLAPFLTGTAASTWATLSQHQKKDFTGFH